MSFATAVAALLLVTGGPTLADRQAVEFEAKVIAELTAAAPAAVPDGQAAGEAYRAARWQEAFDGYATVLAKAPRFPHALRRQCRARDALGDRAGALPLCRAALAAATTPANRMALSSVLAERVGGAQPAPAERSEARTLARLAFDAEPADLSTAANACAVALQVDDLQLLKDCSARLQRIAPGELATEYFAVFGALVHDEYQAARQHLAAARAAGLRAEPADELGTIIDGREPSWSRWGPLAAAALLAWVAVLALLLLAGVILSAATLRGARRLATDRNAGGGGALRKVYAAVLWLTWRASWLGGRSGASSSASVSSTA